MPFKQTRHTLVRCGLGAVAIAALTCAVLPAAVPSATASTTAEGHKVPRTVVVYCKKDYQRLCPRYKINTRSATLCMKSYAKELSPVCKKAMIDTGLADKYGY